MQQTAKPPIVNFIMKPIEDRPSSIKAGYKVHVDVAYIELIPHGSAGKTSVQYVYAEWRDRIRNEVNSGDDYNPSRFPKEWFDRIEAAYTAWLKGEELPVDGTPIRLWAALSPAEIRNVEGAGYRTIEELASANEEGVRNMGMGARPLIDRAKAWVQTKTEPAAKTSAELAALRTENKQLQETVDRQHKEMLMISDRLKVLEVHQKTAA